VLASQVIESRARDAVLDDPEAGAILVSTLTLKTGAEGIRMKEGTAINKSLLTLGNVINKLSEGAAAAGVRVRVLIDGPAIDTCHLLCGAAPLRD